MSTRKLSGICFSISIFLALRNLLDHAYLADLQLSELRIIQRQLAVDKNTHIERG